ATLDVCGRVLGDVVKNVEVLDGLGGQQRKAVDGFGRRSMDLVFTALSRQGQSLVVFVGNGSGGAGVEHDQASEAVSMPGAGGCGEQSAKRVGNNYRPGPIVEESSVFRYPDMLRDGVI